MIDNKFSDIFSWEEFYDRYINNHEEFTFLYNNVQINLVTDYDVFLYTIGTDETGFVVSQKFKTPKDLLDNALFFGKKLEDIWDDLQ